MALFQQSVLKKHIESLNTATIDEKWKLFQTHFHNAVIQQNIRQLKEEQYQGEFLEDLFVKIFGYTKAPSPDFNLITEQKNITNSKKADGAIIVNEKALAVIELKGTDTTDLAKIESQAFGYKSNQPGCNYVITSNFEKLRFYIDNTTQFEEFNLFTLDKPSFELLYCCLDWESISKNTPVNLLNQSVSKENAITKHLYRDYSEFKRNLFDNLVELNPQFDKLELFKKTQKLLDRFLFIFFAEDRLLLPTNLIRRINQEWEELQNMRIPVSLYDRYKIYFNDLNEGARVTLPAFGNKTGEAIKETHDIFAYNGGLFKPDEFLDNLKIDDQLLYNYTLKLSDYDFQSEVDVNILGHIFENSLNEIDEIKSEIEGKEVDRTKTKRKKDGVFYTPKYITKYIVDNTVGKLCTEKKAEIKLIEEEYHTDKNLQTKTKKALLDKLTSYREWLLQLTICDPACGSGAFLNQALEFLIAEHRYIDELQAKLMGDSMVLSDVETSILENNIYGVDLNDESIEIAKLSLWLRTAQKGRKLNSLNNNIKCGNSLIDDTKVAGEKAFSWEKEFPEVFDRGGFDVIIGNPPYVQLQSLGSESETLKNIGYETFDKGADLYCLFTEKGYNLLKKGGIQSFIMPNKWMIVSYGKPLRRFLSKTGLKEILNFGDIQFFEGAATIVCIFVTQKLSNPFDVKVLSLNQRNYSGDFFNDISIKSYKESIDNFGENEWIIKPVDVSKKLNKMKKNGIPLKELSVNIFRGILTGYNEAFYIDLETKNKLISEDPKSDELIKMMIRGRDVIPYGYSDFEYLIGTFPSLKIDIEKYPSIKNHLMSFGYDRLKQTGDKGARKKTSGNWFETQDSISYWREFTKPKIIYPNMTSLFPFMYDESGVFANQKCFILSSKDENISLLALTAIFNSSLCKLWINYNCPELLGGTREISKVYFEKFPVPFFDDKQKNILENFTNLNNKKTTDFQKLTQKFKTYFSSQYHLEKISGKLEKWYELEFTDFIKELNKAIKTTKGTPLTKKDEFEWMELFEDNKKKALELKAEIDKTDKEIDQMVYELYGLTDEEVKIVEGF